MIQGQVTNIGVIEIDPAEVKVKVERMEDWGDITDSGHYPGPGAGPPENGGPTYLRGGPRPSTKLEESGQVTDTSGSMRHTLTHGARGLRPEASDHTRRLVSMRVILFPGLIRGCFTPPDAIIGTHIAGFPDRGCLTRTIISTCGESIEHVRRVPMAWGVSHAARTIHRDQEEMIRYAQASTGRLHRASRDR
jgi:hypothetical protein